MLDARDRYPESTLAHLYDPDLTPPDLRKAHQNLDQAVDRLYTPKEYKTESQRLRHLLDLYQESLGHASLRGDRGLTDINPQGNYLGTHAL